MRHYRTYTNDDIIVVASQVNSMSQLLKSLGLKGAGGNYINMRRLLQDLNIDCSHWTGCGWSKDKQLKKWGDYTKANNLKKHLIKLRGNKCQRCLNIHWLDQEIKLEIHHIDCDRTNNELTNLQLLCPNCHSFTNGFRNSKKS